ncbi:hypothetical protein OIE66_08120 [Nonomuraea sp. NBC_01738]|uniref:hypothetical protein n=1 Tax=Nonomuraea sp. NBC_01738 TaxID=2976003 RepID=UPI002E11EA2D|nr:hypothetical protein OIE66_08120 [Nonomuraea sp. NBC_01738]
MRRTLRYVALWCAATAVAICVSWFGVSGVLRSEFVDDVRYLPLAAQTGSDENLAPVIATAPTVPTAPTATPTPTPAPTARRTARRTPTPAPTLAAPREDVRVVSVVGGEVAFTIGPEGCALVSATPRSGYTAKVSTHAAWIRVDLVRGEHGSGVWCISAERRTDTWEY